MDTLDRCGTHAKLVSTTTAPFDLGRSSRVRRRTSSQLNVGSLFGHGRYELLEAIATGGTSVVHAVYDRVLDRKLAGKFLVLDQDHRVAAAARLEARATARLSHPNIVTVHDVGVWDETPFLLMELLRGDTLTDEIARHRLSPRRAVEVALEVASGLDHAHQHGVLHLDLKPGNVHMGDDGTVKLLDFGVGSAHLNSMTTDEEPTVVGTPGYMAPEQWSFAQLDARADVWALGILLYECLSGRLPGDGQHPGFALASGRAFSVPPLSSEFSLPSSIDSVIQRALTTDPTHRCRTVREFVTMLGVVQRVLLDRDVHDLSNSERWLAGAADVIEGEFEAREMQTLTGLPRAMVSKRLASLVRIGALRAHRGAPDVRYSVNDRALSHACFQRFEPRDRSRILHRLCASHSV